MPGDTRARRRVENTRAIRELIDALSPEVRERLALSIELARKICRHCGQSAWRVTHTEGGTRYLKCLGCGRTDKVTIGGGP